MENRDVHRRQRHRLRSCASGRRIRLRYDRRQLSCENLYRYMGGYAESFHSVSQFGNQRKYLGHAACKVRRRGAVLPAGICIHYDRHQRRLAPFRRRRPERRAELRRADHRQHGDDDRKNTEKRCGPRYFVPVLSGNRQKRPDAHDVRQDQRRISGARRKIPYRLHRYPVCTGRICAGSRLLLSSLRRQSPSQSARLRADRQDHLPPSGVPCHFG